MKLIANRQFSGPWGRVTEGGEFECSDLQQAQELIKKGLARKADPPKILYETKVIEPPEVGPAVPFRDLSVPHEKPEAVAAASDQVLSEPNLPQPGAADSRRRRGRSGVNRK